MIDPKNKKKFKTRKSLFKDTCPSIYLSKEEKRPIKNDLKNIEEENLFNNILIFKKLFHDEKQNSINDPLTILEFKLDEMHVSLDFFEKNINLMQFFSPSCFEILKTVFFKFSENQYIINFSDFNLLKILCENDLT